MYGCMYVRMHVCMCECMHACMHCMYCMHVCMWVCSCYTVICVCKYVWRYIVVYISQSQRGSWGGTHTCAGIPLHPFELTTHAMHTCMHTSLRTYHARHAYIHARTSMHTGACTRVLLQRQGAEQRQQKLQIEPVSTGSATAKVPALCPCPSVICYKGIYMCVCISIYI